MAKFKKLLIILTLVGLAAYGGWYALESREDEQLDKYRFQQIAAVPKEQFTPVTAEEISTDIKENLDKACQKYENQYIRLTGTLLSLDQKAKKALIVTDNVLETVLTKTGLVLCQFSDAEQFAKLNTPCLLPWVTIYGECTSIASDDRTVMINAVEVEDNTVQRPCPTLHAIDYFRDKYALGQVIKERMAYSQKLSDNCTAEQKQKLNEYAQRALTLLNKYDDGKFFRIVGTISDMERNEEVEEREKNSNMTLRFNMRYNITGYDDLNDPQIRNNNIVWSNLSYPLYFFSLDPINGSIEEQIAQKKIGDTVAVYIYSPMNLDTNMNIILGFDELTPEELKKEKDEYDKFKLSPDDLRLIEQRAKELKR